MPRHFIWLITRRRREDITFRGRHDDDTPRSCAIIAAFHDASLVFTPPAVKLVISARYYKKSTYMTIRPK